MVKRQCKGKTKAGKRCKAAPLTDGDYCAAHDPLQPAETRFGSSEQAAVAGAKGGAAGRHPRAVDVIRERMEADIELVLGPLFEALEADRGIVVGAGENAVLEHVADWDARLRAIKEILDRSYGRPKQSLEHSGRGGEPIQMEVSAEVAKAAHDFLENVRRVQENDS